METNYRELLKKYMKLVEEEEGTNYTDRLNDGLTNIVFTEQERDELIIIAWEIRDND